MPPRHGKSELGSKRFPAWLLGRNPTWQIIVSSYAKDLARGFGREIRNLFNEDDFQNVFEGIRLARDSRAADRWNTNKGGIFVAAGVDSGITGKGADVAIVDDPFKGRDEADSKKRRDHVWNWYNADLYTRLMPHGRIVIITTRWHEDDLVGRLEKREKEGGDKWERLSLAAILNEDTDHEEALWPEWFSLEELRHKRKQLLISSPRDWYSLFQQRPPSASGTYFSNDWIQYYDEIPPGLHIYGSSDFAVTEGKGDFTEHAVLGIDERDDIYILDWWYGQASSDVWTDAKIDLWQKWKPLAWFGESGVIRRATEPDTERESHRRRVYCREEWLAPVNDKPTRARAIQARFARRKVWLPRSPWAGRLVAQLLAFPNGEHDDAVDALSLFGLALDETHPAIIERIQHVPRDRYGRHDDDDRDSYRS